MKISGLRAFLVLTAAALCSCGAAGDTERDAAPPGKPNIVFILVDDLGWKDLGCTGSTLYETPHIDALASEGMRFTRAYAAAPVCSPTRASIMTGRYPARVKVTEVLRPRGDYGLSPEEWTLAEMLKGEGYATGAIGKWHLGGTPRFWPEKQGFDVNIAGTGYGMPRSFFWPRWKGNPPIEGNAPGENLTERLSDEAVRFIEAHGGRPFFLYLAFYAVHIPIEGKADKTARYREKLKKRPPRKGEHFNPTYAAMIETVDDGVGRVRETLKRLKIDGKTIVIFFSDNGGLHIRDGGREIYGPATSNLPLRAGKGTLYEGGIREPCIVKWPGVTPPGSVCDTPIISVDFFPTIATLVGLDASKLPTKGPLDGLDLSGLLKDPDAGLEREALYWYYPHYDLRGARPGGVIRAGDWKLIERYDNGQIELFNLEEDPGEKTDLAGKMPDQAARLKRMLAAWRREMNVTAPSGMRRR